LTPSKIELLSSWVPRQRWVGDADTSALRALGAYRFDDPAGAVGIETHLLGSADGQVLQVPLTYRDAPLAGAESALLGTLDHSVLGQRWVYDGCGDPVYTNALATAVLSGGTEAKLEVLTDAGLVPREPTTRVRGSGSPDVSVPALASVSQTNDGTTTVIAAEALQLLVFRVIGADAAPGDALTLHGTWPGREEPTLLALARPGGRM
jgi:hypothetical protein